MEDAKEALENVSKSYLPPAPLPPAFRVGEEGELPCQLLPTYTLLVGGQTSPESAPGLDTSVVRPENKALVGEVIMFINMILDLKVTVVKFF